MGIEILNSDPLVTSLYVQDGPGHARITVRVRGTTTGELVVAHEDAALVSSRLLGPQGHEHTGAGTILDRCISLVQSMASHPDPTEDGVETVVVWAEEARTIAKDAGWT